MENQIKTPVVLLALACLVSGCSTPPAPYKATAPLAAPSEMSVMQVPNLGFVFCETDACPAPTTKTPPTASRITVVQKESRSPPNFPDGKTREASLEIAFKFNKSDISAADAQLLARTLQEVNPTTIRIVGRSDFVGPPQAQTKLANDRAQALRTALSSTSSLPKISVEVEVAAPNRVNASLQAQQRRGSVFFVR